MSTLDAAGAESGSGADANGDAGGGGGNGKRLSFNRMRLNYRHGGKR